MADSPILPGGRAWKDAGGRPLPVEFYRFLRDLVRFIAEIQGNTDELSEIEAQIADILERLESLESGEGASIIGPQSVRVTGSLQSGIVQITLVNDEAQPKPAHFYASDDSRNKGWLPLQPNWVPNPYAVYLVDENGDYMVDENGNFLISDTGFPINPDYLPDHNLLNGQQGGTDGERYHLTSAQHSELSAILSTAPVDVTGSRGGNAALASLLTGLATIGLITDSTTV